MSRLTYKVNDAYYVKDPRHLYDDTWELVQELGKLEDLEDELGCPLVVVFKALKEGIYCYDSDNEEIRRIITHFQYNSTSKEYYWYGNNIHFPNLKDYGKTWWLVGESK